MADEAMTDLGPEGDRWLTGPFGGPEIWTDHFARQLGFHSVDRHLHDTLLFVLRQLDDWFKSGWPPPQIEAGGIAALAHEATKHLEPLELYGTLLAGPRRWLREGEAGGELGKLAGRLRLVLERLLAGELSRVLNDWVKWDIPRLAERRARAIKAQEDRQREPARSRDASALPRVRPRRDPKELTPRFQPPGRT